MVVYGVVVVVGGYPFTKTRVFGFFEVALIGRLKKYLNPTANVFNISCLSLTLTRFLLSAT